MMHNVSNINCYKLITTNTTAGAVRSCAFKFVFFASFHEPNLDKSLSSLLEHELRQILVENRVFDRVEDEANVVGINRHCEMVKERFVLVSFQRFKP